MVILEKSIIARQLAKTGKLRVSGGRKRASHIVTLTDAFHKHERIFRNETESMGNVRIF
jgi:hypothetical protein